PLRLARRGHQPSSTTHATARPPSCESVRWLLVHPIAWYRSSATPENRSRGTWPPGWITSACFQPTPFESPVPIALNAASLAAKRAARWGIGSLWRLQYSSSPGVNRRASMRSPNRSSESINRSTLTTSTPIPRTATGPPQVHEKIEIGNLERGGGVVKSGPRPGFLIAPE